MIRQGSQICMSCTPPRVASKSPAGSLEPPAHAGRGSMAVCDVESGGAVKWGDPDIQWAAGHRIDRMRRLSRQVCDVGGECGIPVEVRARGETLTFEPLS